MNGDGTEIGPLEKEEGTFASHRENQGGRGGRERPPRNRKKMGNR